MIGPMNATLRTAALTFLLFTTLAAFGADFQPGDLIVLRVGDNITSANTSASVATFLDEYTLGGSLVQSIALPTAASGANAALTVAGNSSTEGQILRSADGQYITVMGYNTAPGTAAPSGVAPGTINRVVGLVNVHGAVDTSTALSTSTLTGNARGAATDNGTHFWVSTSSGGMHYVGSVGATSATQLGTGNARMPGIFNHQLYASVASSGTGFGISQVGSGLPTSSPTTLSLLPGFNLTQGPSYSANGLYMADLNHDNTLDTAWIAEDNNATVGGIQRYSFDGSTWNLSYTLGLGTTFRAVTVDLSGATPLVFGTTSGSGGSVGNRLVEFVDTGASASPITIATASALAGFRGIAFTPSQVPEPSALALFGLGGLCWSLVLRRSRAK
jgi:hypothetical protein